MTPMDEDFLDEIEEELRRGSPGGPNAPIDLKHNNLARVTMQAAEKSRKPLYQRTMEMVDKFIFPGHQIPEGKTLEKHVAESMPEPLRRVGEKANQLLEAMGPVDPTMTVGALGLLRVPSVGGRQGLAQVMREVAPRIRRQFGGMKAIDLIDEKQAWEMGRTQSWHKPLPPGRGGKLSEIGLVKKTDLPHEVIHVLESQAPREFGQIMDDLWKNSPEKWKRYMMFKTWKGGGIKIKGEFANRPAHEVVDMLMRDKQAVAKSMRENTAVLLSRDSYKPHGTMKASGLTQEQIAAIRRAEDIIHNKGIQSTEMITDLLAQEILEDMQKGLR